MITKDLPKKDRVQDQTPRRVLFVCTGNTCRSPMAAAWLNHVAAPREVCSMAGEPSCFPPILATSAGLYAVPGAPITPTAVTALLEAGVVPRPANNYPMHGARPVTEELMKEADTVLTVTDGHAMELLMRFPTYAGKISTLPLEIPDPYGGTPADYKACLDRLQQAIALFFGEGAPA